MSGEITAGELSAFVFYAVVVAGAVGAISEVIGDLQRAAGATERLIELLETSPRSRRRPSRGFAGAAARRPGLRGRSPSTTRPAPSARPWTASTSKVCAGRDPGPGRPLGRRQDHGVSAAAALLRSAVRQAITLDGLDLRSVDPGALRTRIGLVAQEPVIFSAECLGEHPLRPARWRATRRCAKAAEAASALDFLEALPEGLNTFLGQRGVRLSGGQRQRIAIARAILRDPAVLLLDEATSSLDAESERAVQEALDRLKAGRTTLVIAHRLATVLQADRIVVMDQGRIVAQGRHAELIRAGGLYARLAELQFDAARNLEAAEEFEMETG